jgi:hypothetical protein
MDTRGGEVTKREMEASVHSRAAFDAEASNDTLKQVVLQLCTNLEDLDQLILV